MTRTARNTAAPTLPVLTYIDKGKKRATAEKATLKQFPLGWNGRSPALVNLSLAQL